MKASYSYVENPMAGHSQTESVVYRLTFDLGLEGLSHRT